MIHALEYSIFPHDMEECCEPQKSKLHVSGMALLIACCAEGAADETSEPSSSGQGDLLLALDCEMCETLPGTYELTRISLLDVKHNVSLLQNLTSDQVLIAAFVSISHREVHFLCFGVSHCVLWRLQQKANELHEDVVEAAQSIQFELGFLAGNI